MALEDGGISINVDRLKAKLKERYPDYNFDIPPEPDTKHKAPSICFSSFSLTQNTFCIFLGYLYSSNSFCTKAGYTAGSTTSD